MPIHPSSNNLNSTIKVVWKIMPIHIRPASLSFHALINRDHKPTKIININKLSYVQSLIWKISKVDVHFFLFVLGFSFLLGLECNTGDICLVAFLWLWLLCLLLDNFLQFLPNFTLNLTYPQWNLQLLVVVRAGFRRRVVIVELG